MKIGSLVCCINNGSDYATYGMLKPTKEAVYTVREIVISGTVYGKGIVRVTATEDLIYLEELVNQKIDCGYGVLVEPAYCMKDFRELLPPMEKELEELISEDLVCV